jgi:predicted adenine nucleotide alpha hydrolase (AANH) superfamily ATPase
MSFMLYNEINIMYRQNSCSCHYATSNFDVFSREAGKTRSALVLVTRTSQSMLKTSVDFALSTDE